MSKLAWQIAGGVDFDECDARALTADTPRGVGLRSEVSQYIFDAGGAPEDCPRPLGKACVWSTLEDRVPPSSSTGCCDECADLLRAALEAVAPRRG